LNFVLGSLIEARSFAKDNSEVSSNQNYVFEENHNNRNKSIKRSCAGSSKEFIVPKLPMVSSEGNYNSYLIIIYIYIYIYIYIIIGYFNN